MTPRRLSLPQEDPLSPASPLKRRHHQKKRTGCRACKLRHKKCSEERPQCTKCIKRGHTCPGYDEIQSQMIRPVHMDIRTFRNSFISTRPKFILSDYNFVPTHHPIELGAFEFFHTQTLPNLCSILTSDIWQAWLTSVGRSIPAIMHTVLAFGAYHQQISSLGYVNWKSSNHADSSGVLVQFALYHHAKAAELIRESVSSADPPLQVIKVACALFTILEFLQGNRMAAISHLTSGMGLLEHQKVSHKASRFDLWAESTLSSLSLSQALYGRPRSVRFPNLWVVPLPDEGRSPLSFANIEEARIANFNLNGLVLLFVHKVEQVVDPQAPEITIEQKSLSIQLADWKAAVNILVAQNLTEVEAEAIALMRAHQKISWIFEVHRDLLRKAPRREALWDAEEAALAAEVAISFEECDMYKTENKRQIILPPEERRLHDVDIQEPDSAYNGSLRVVLKSRPFAGCRIFQETVKPELQQYKDAGQDSYKRDDEALLATLRKIIASGLTVPSWRPQFGHCDGPLQYDRRGNPVSSLVKYSDLTATRPLRPGRDDEVGTQDGVLKSHSKGV
ncbi:hypothetical protein V502_07396 [Pseudogymnoascus sp. VKM F-4520 (FW-2644)]|nr:hypothetical protein V502_07396 [Pseudogymnoascus sp. VKM F-4520 (FW-2644)]